MPSRAPTSVRWITLLFVALLAAPAGLQAQPLLSSDNLNSWTNGCWRCDIDLQYDVIHGEVIRFSADRLFGATLENRIRNDALYPELSWFWSLDPFLDPAVYFSLEVHFRAKETRRKYKIRYVWDSSVAEDSVRAVKDKENHWVWVVTGETAAPLRWYEVRRNLAEDFAAVSGLQSAVNIHRIVVGLGSGEQRKLTASGYLSGIQLTPQSEPLWPADTLSSD